MNWERTASTLTIVAPTAMMVIAFIGILSAIANQKLNAAKSSEQLARHENTLKLIWNESNRTRRNNIQAVVTYRLGARGAWILPDQAVLDVLFQSPRLQINARHPDMPDTATPTTKWGIGPLMNNPDMTLYANRLSINTSENTYDGEPSSWTIWMTTLYFSDATGEIAKHFEFLTNWNGAEIEVLLQHQCSESSFIILNQWLARLEQDRDTTWRSPSPTITPRYPVDIDPRSGDTPEIPQNPSEMVKLAGYVGRIVINNQYFINAINGYPFSSHKFLGNPNDGFTSSDDIRSMFSFDGSGQDQHLTVLPFDVEIEVFISERLIVKKKGLAIGVRDGHGYEDFYTFTKFPITHVDQNAFPKLVEIK